MKRFLIDTNCIVSYVTDRNLKQQEVITRFFEDAANFKCEIVILNNIITEFIYVLEKIYEIEPNKIREILKALSETPGILIDHKFDLGDVLKLWPQIIKDYGDAVLASYAKQEKIPLLTFDQILFKQLSRNKIPVKNLLK